MVVLYKSCRVKNSPSQLMGGGPPNDWKQPPLETSPSLTQDPGSLRAVATSGPAYSPILRGVNCLVLGVGYTDESLNSPSETNNTVYVNKKRKI